MRHTIIAALLLLGLARNLPAAEPLQTARNYVVRGETQFKENRITESIADFDKAAELQPAAAPHLWQRGISYYYADEFKKGREQFELHKSVNPHDVENATWHFICVAKQENLEAARKAIIEINTTRDTRVPMAEVYELYAGQGSVEAILAAAAKAGTERAQMYAHLYLGLYYEVAGQEQLAKKHMLKSAAAKLQDHYMHEVAKIHLLQRNWE